MQLAIVVFSVLHNAQSTVPFNTVQLAQTLAMYRITTPADVKREFLVLMRNSRICSRYFEHVDVGLMN